MRGWTRSGVLRAATLVVVALSFALVATGCGADAAPSPTPTPRVTPTPDPHLSEPVSVDEIFSTLTRSGLRILPNNAATGRSGEPVKRINSTYEGWPLALVEYSSSRALAAETGFVDGAAPGVGGVPYTFAGLNILVIYGPESKAEPPGRVDDRFKTAAEAMVAILDPLLGPLGQSSSDPVTIPSAPDRTPPASPSPSPEVSPSP